MKRILFFFLLIAVSFVSKAQFPVTQFIGADSTLVKSRGGLMGRFAPIPFTDTTSANLSRISQYPGALIYTSGVDKYWYRNATTTGWIEFTSSGGSTVNIYNSNGTISEDRYVDGGEHRLQFNALQSFQVAADSITFNLVENYLFLTGLVSTQDTSTYKPIVVDPITGRVLQSSYWYGGGDSSIFATVYRTDTLAANIRSEISALPTPTLQQVLATEGNSPHIQGATLNMDTTSFNINDASDITIGTYFDAGQYSGIYMTPLVASFQRFNEGKSISITLNDSIIFNTNQGNINIDSLNSGSSTDSVLVWDEVTGKVKKRNASAFGGGGSGVTTIGTINGTTKSANGGVISGSTLYLQTVDATYPGLMTSAQKARLDSNIYFQSGEGVEIYVVNDSTYGFKLKYDTTALASFGAGSAAAGDTTAFSTSAIYGSFFNSGSDTLIITRMQIGIQGTSPNITLDVFWNDSLNVSAGATKLVTAGNTATNIYTGTSVTSFDNTKIPPGNWVWVKSSTVAVKPTYLTTTLIGYKKRVTP